MRICFIHQNMPAQFRHLIAALLQRGDEVLAVGERGAVERWGVRHPRLSVFGYGLPEPKQLAATPAHLREFDAQIARGQAVARALRTFNAKGLKPDLIVVHPGWGEALFIRGECPDTPLLGYCEFFYRARGADVGFDPEYPSGPDALARLQLRKTPHLLALDDIDAGVCPTEWQRAQFPAVYQPRLSVVHEGVDTRLVRPDALAEFAWQELRLRRGDPVVTYVARNLEPYRGFHVFMRSLPALQARAPQARVVVVGGDEVSYGQRLPPGESYRARLQAELGERVDWSRVHFTGKLPYPQYLQLLQVSAVHAYLTYPFVLSWSMLEAMASGCAVVGSRTAPVEEVIEHGRNGWLTDFFDTEALAERLAQVLQGGAKVEAVRRAARATVVERYDLATRCLPQGLKLLERVASSGRSRPA
ncbi:glycosyltransferase family 4 protein [Azohydromonas caseinilytica]|uniref:Glycosyltransferase n=1 Tax=Azohydromonas caseinilytica TaxID=2728836 RepID=A0A848F605_9BURK|nr:glycosyltransferase family 4 protein [Azohydromonas caseinilytica]NML14096.1 glycosyltransferase [Azohydromonas caseinilytica]